MSPVADAVECPQCGKYSIVKAEDFYYHCLNCNFHRDLSDILAQILMDLGQEENALAESLELTEESHPSDLNPLVFILLAILFGFLVV
jgi:hypothetical protein